MARLIWTDGALADLESLLQYIETDAPLAARRLADRIVAHVEQLTHHPLSGGIIAEVPQGDYREVLVGNYRIIYRCDDDRVYLLTIWHAARLLKPDDLP